MSRTDPSSSNPSGAILSRATLALHLSPGRSTLIESMLDSALQNGLLRHPWRIVAGDQAAAILGINAVARGPGDAMSLRLDYPTGPQSTTLGWPVSPLTLASLLNGLTQAWHEHGPSPADLPAGEAHRLLASWLELGGGRGEALSLVDGNEVLAVLNLSSDAWLGHAELKDPAAAAQGLSRPGANWRRGALAHEGLTRVGSARRLLWAIAGLAAPLGILGQVAQQPALTLRGWPYLIAKGPAVWGECARAFHLQAGGVRDLLQRHPEQAEAVAHFVNGCFATGFLRASDVPVPVSATAEVARDTPSSPSRLSRALGSIRRALGMVWRQDS